MEDKYILSIDCGTQSLRALLFDRFGNLAGKEKVKFEPYYSLYPGWAEQDPEIYYKSLCKACLGLREKSHDLWDKIIGITLTTQRDTCINIDKNGKVLRPAIVWLDQRMARYKNPLPFYDNLMFYIAGMTKAVKISIRKTKSNWIKENEPEIWKKTHKFLLLSGYLTYKLTGKMVDSTACQVGHIPFDYKNMCWPKSDLSWRWPVFGIEREKLVDIVKPGELLGNITGEVSCDTGIKEGLPVIASGSDKGCETVGNGCLDETYANISFGTTATVQTTSKKYFEPIKFMPSYPASIVNSYNPEIQIFRGYWMISWFKREFCKSEVEMAKKMGVSTEKILDEMLDQVPPGSYGLILQPYWSPGLKMPTAKGAVIGFGDVHTKAHFYRAIIEGIDYALLEGIKKIESKSHKKVEKITVSGGGSQSDRICQITADIAGRPVLRGLTYEVSGLGAAINGFVGLNIYKSYEEAVSNMVHYKKVFEPDEKNMKVYTELYERVYKKMYKKLYRLYGAIQDITDYPDI